MYTMAGGPPAWAMKLVRSDTADQNMPFATEGPAWGKPCMVFNWDILSQCMEIAFK